MKKLLITSTLGVLLLLGCTTNQVITAYKTETAVDASVVAAWGLWTNYATIMNVPLNTRTSVASAFNKVKAAEIVAVQTTAVAANSTNQSFITVMTSNIAAESAALTDLGNLLATFNIKLP